jgi:hypothetical protein
MEKPHAITSGPPVVAAARAKNRKQCSLILRVHPSWIKFIGQRPRRLCSLISRRTALAQEADRLPYPSSIAVHLYRRDVQFAAPNPLRIAWRETQGRADKQNYGACMSPSMTARRWCERVGPSERDGLFREGRIAPGGFDRY